MNAKVSERKSSRRKSQKRNWISFALVCIGVLLLGVSLYAYVAPAPAATGSTKYDPNDVALEKPFLAVHEMEDGPPISFLPANQAQPKIELPEKFYSFGTVSSQDIVEREFIIRNVGDAPLTISRAYTTCGCTTAQISARVIPPGKVATIKLIFDAGFHETAGQTVRRGLIIENNDPQQSQAEIWIQGSVRSN